MYGEDLYNLWNMTRASMKPEEQDRFMRDVGRKMRPLARNTLSAGQDANPVSSIADKLRGWGDKNEIGRLSDKSEGLSDSTIFEEAAKKLIMTQIPRTIGHALQGDSPESEAYKTRKALVESLRNNWLGTQSEGFSY